MIMSIDHWRMTTAMFMTNITSTRMIPAILRANPIHTRTAMPCSAIAILTFPTCIIAIATYDRCEPDRHVIRSSAPFGMTSGRPRRRVIPSRQERHSDQGG